MEQTNFTEYLITRENIRGFLMSAGADIATHNVRLLGGGTNSLEAVRFEAYIRTVEGFYESQDVLLWTFTKAEIIGYLSANGASDVTMDWVIYMAVYSLLPDGRIDETSLVVTNNIRRSQETRGRT